MALSWTAGPAAAAGDEETVARNFLAYLRSDKAIVETEALEGSLLAADLAPVAVGHLFRLGGGGYILVSPDRSISPVKAYSLSGDFADLPTAYRNAVLAELELRVRVAAVGTGARRPLSAEPTETERQWNFLLAFDAARRPLAYTPGTFLVTSRWNQGHPYNLFLPKVGDQSAVAGCVNVALGQVMRYHGHPASAQGVVAYTWTPPAPQPPELLRTVLFRSYNWANMPDRVDGATPGHQRDEVALLLRDLGIANRTTFDAGGSSTALDTRMVMENFGYSTGLSEMDNANYSGFLARIKGEVDAGRPLLLSFPGHMVVADGYGADPVGDWIHINMGWGGTADDFYFLNDTVKAGGYQFPTDAGYLTIYHGIKPCSPAAGDCAVNLESGDAITGLAIAGDFHREKDADRYEVYLKGATTVSATRGYDNLAFYLFIQDLTDGRMVFQVADPAAPDSGGAVFSVGTLPAGKYAVRVSTCNETGTVCYAPSPSSHYTVTLTSEPLAAEEQATVDAALDKPPVIGNAFPDLLLDVAAGTRKLLIDARDENGDAVTLRITGSNPAAVTAAPLNGNILLGNVLDLTPTGAAKVASRITVSATAGGRTVEKSFTVMTDNGDTAFGRSFTVAGTFAGQSDVESHRVVLDRDCTITGSRPGIRNQAFFSSLRDVVNTIVGSADGDTADGHNVIGGTFPQGIYRLEAALCSGGACYPFTAGDTYSFVVSCSTADEGTATIAGLLGVDLTGAFAWGDLDADGRVTLADAVFALQILSHIDASGRPVRLEADVNDNGKIGPAEAVFILQKAAGLRN
jgi:hypothetical protein